MSIDWSAVGVRESGVTNAIAKDNSSLGQADFLTLLTTQLKNQDPLSPLDNAAFVAQLAQFSTVSGITEMNASLGAMATLAEADTRSAAPQWIGRTVVGSNGVSGEVVAVDFGDDGSPTLNLDSGTRLSVANVAHVA